jgi:hypothetical protein
MVIDTTPPAISGMNISGTRNEDGSFEWGSIIDLSIQIFEGDPPEKEVQGDLRVYRMGILQNITRLEIDPLGTALRTKIQTADIGKGDLDLTAVVRDGFGNKVNSTSSISIRDTTPPGFSLYLSEGITYPHEAGKELHIQLAPALMEDVMDPWVEIFSEGETGTMRLINLTDPMWDPHSQSFVFRWMTTGLQTGMYHVEGRMRDEDGNYRREGEKEGWDLTVLLKDVTPPLMEGMRIDGILVEQGSSINVTGGFMLRVISFEREVGMQCTITVSNSAGYLLKEVELIEFARGIFQLYFDNRTIPFGTSSLEVVLSDRWGNSDPDGYGPGPDLAITLERSPVKIITLSGLNLATGSTLTPDRMGWIIAGEGVRFHLALSNFTMEDTLHFYAGSSISILEPTIMVDGLSHFQNEIDTTSMVGDIDVWWRIFPLHLDGIEVGPFSLKVVRNETEPPVVRTITGWTDLGNGTMMVNISWGPLEGAGEFRIYVLYGDPAGAVPDTLLAILPGSAVNGSFEVLRQNVTFLITAIFELFPPEADRILRVESFDPRNETEGGSLISFHPPPPIRNEVVEEVGTDHSILWLIIPFSLVAIIMLLTALLVVANRRRNVIWDME